MNHIYVIGAGASNASADTPLGRDLVWNYHINCGLLVPYGNGGPDLREENEDFSNFRKFLELAASIYPECKHLPEKWDKRGAGMFTYDGIEKRHYIDEMLEVLHQKKDSNGINLVRKLIFEHLAESSIGNPNLLYERFIGRVLKNSGSEQVTIISFNFDVLLHEDFKANVYFDYLLKFDWVDDNRQQIYARNNPIKLIKPNGSLDWGICPSCNRLHLYFPHMFRNFFDDKKCTGNCGDPIQPFIIVPHEQYQAIIEPLWSAAEKELKRANKVTVIGYSFPEYDKKVIDLFSTSLGANTELQVVSRCESHEDEDRKRKAITMKCKKLFPTLKPDIDIHLDGFEGYVTDHGN